jgi:hypothetical protein
MSARKNRPHACINLVRTHNVPAMTLAKNAKTEPKDTRYNKSFIALQLAPYRARGLGFARRLISRSGYTGPLAQHQFEAPNEDRCQGKGKTSRPLSLE